MLDRLKRQIIRFLDARQVGMLTAWGLGEPWALPVRYLRDGMEIICRLPAWADPFAYEGGHFLARLVIPRTSDDTHTWIEVDGSAEQLETQAVGGSDLFPGGSSARATDYRMLRIRSRRISIVDETRGWGFRETLDL